MVDADTEHSKAPTDKALSEFAALSGCLQDFQRLSVAVETARDVVAAAVVRSIAVVVAACAPASFVDPLLAPHVQSPPWETHIRRLNYHGDRVRPDAVSLPLEGLPDTFNASSPTAWDSQVHGIHPATAEGHDGVVAVLNTLKQSQPVPRHSDLNAVGFLRGGEEPADTSSGRTSLRDVPPGCPPIGSCGPCPRKAIASHAAAEGGAPAPGPAIARLTEACLRPPPPETIVVGSQLRRGGAELPAPSPTPPRARRALASGFGAGRTALANHASDGAAGGGRAWPVPMELLAAAYAAPAPRPRPPPAALREERRAAQAKRPVAPPAQLRGALRTLGRQTACNCAVAEVLRAPARLPPLDSSLGATRRPQEPEQSVGEWRLGSYQAAWIEMAPSCLPAL